MDPSDHLVIFVRAPRPGTVKTRIGAELGDPAALRIYRRLLDVLAARLAPLPSAEWRVTPDEALEEIRPWLQAGWRAVPQGKGDLTARLIRAFGEAFAAGARRVVVIGSDCPEITAEDIRDAWRLLEEHDVVLGPAADGGYWAIGLNSPQPRLFEEIPWSTARVLEATRQRAQAAGLRHASLRTLPDIDTAADWDAWQQRNRA